MQISDMLGQYNRNVTNGTEELRGAQSTQKLVSSVGDLSAGSVFEGTVNHVRGGKVILALGNGQVISARLDGKVDLKPGTAMFFQVKSNDGLTVSIRPYNGAGNANNPILLNALTAAQIPATERTLMMVDAMMQEQMSVDRQSILDMVKILNANPESNVQTIVQMTKLGMPVTETLASQFEQYLSDQHSLLNEMQLAVGQMAETLGDEGLAVEDSFALYSKMVDIFLGNGENVAGNSTVLGQEPSAGALAGNGLDFVAFGEAVQEPTDQLGATANQELADELLQQAVNGEQQTVAAQNGQQTTAAQNGEQGMPNTIGTLLSEEQIASLTKSLQDIPTLLGNTELFVSEANEEIFVDTMQDEAIELQMQQEEVQMQPAQEMALNKNMTASEFMQSLQRALSENSQYGFAGVQKLFAGKEFQTLLRSMAAEQWLIHPQELKEEGKLGKLYEKMERQIGQMETAMRAVGIEQNSFLQTASDIRGNIEFMNQMNQIYHYVQIPLKMSGQNANGELYVYSNRKRLDDPDAELTAFLHLDMDNLGSTDVSVRMVRKQVKTNFYFDNDASYDIVEKHLPILEKRLKNKGYNCTITITNEKKEINFKENFVKKGRVMSGGSLHRYSFDVRA